MTTLLTLLLSCSSALAATQTPATPADSRDVHDRIVDSFDIVRAITPDAPPAAWCLDDTKTRVCGYTTQTACLKARRILGTLFVACLPDRATR